jgi:hypothetical protein
MSSESETLPTIREDRFVMGSRMAGVVQELQRHRYVADPHLEGTGGTICRHPSAPTLLVRDDGRIELVGGQRASDAVVHLPPAKRIRWGRSVVFLALIGAAAFLGLLVVAMIVG